MKEIVWNNPFSQGNEIFFIFYLHELFHPMSRVGDGGCGVVEHDFVLPYSLIW